MVVRATRLPKSLADFGSTDFIGYLVDGKGVPLNRPVLFNDLILSDGKKSESVLEATGYIIAIFDTDNGWEVKLSNGDAYLLKRLDLGGS